MSKIVLWLKTERKRKLAVSRFLQLTLLGALLLLSKQTSAQTYVNPVIPGDFPDPSVIRVGDDYYATATTGGWAPHFPLLHSKDLINWTVIGAVFEQKPAWAKSDFWAPEIIEDKGRYFVYYTARREEGADKKGTLCVAVATAEKPAGPYTDRGALVCQEMGSIDAFFVRDENNKPFLIWKEDGNDRQQPTWLYAQQLDENGTKLVGKPTKLFRNEAAWENHVVEGSYILRRNGWFYHFYSGNACCGRGCNYALGVARSRKLLGPWEKYDKNPILAANETWQCPGHGSVVRTPDGRDFMLYHAYRRRADAFNIGREALLDEINWTPDGWATINHGRGASNGAIVPFKSTLQKRNSLLVEEFEESPLSPIWQTPLYNEQKIQLENGLLALAAKKSRFEDKTTSAVIAERTVSGNYTATTLIKIEQMTEEERAGLAAYSWRGNAVGVSIGNGKAFAWRRENGKQQIAASEKLPTAATNFYLKMTVSDGELYRFAYSEDNQNWKTLGEPVVGGNVEGARVALTYGGKLENPHARFDWLRVEQK